MTYLSTTARAALVGALVLVTATSAARAQEEPDAARVKAKALLQEGARFMDERQYDRAVESFREAYRLVPSPKVLYNLGVAYLSVARYADALDALERFLAEATDAPVANQETARRHIADLRAKVSTLSLTSDRPRGELLLDGRSLGEIALTGDVTIDAGPHDLRVVADGKVVDQRLTASPGERVAVTLTFNRPAQAPAAPPPATASPAGLTLTAAPAEERPLLRRPWFWAAAGGAVAAAAAVILVIALSRTEYPVPDQTVTPQ